MRLRSCSSLDLKSECDSFFLSGMGRGWLLRLGFLLLLELTVEETFFLYIIQLIVI